MKVFSFIFLITIAFGLTSCGTKCEPKIIKEKEYIYHVVPKELFSVKQLPMIQEMSKQSEVSLYLTELWNTADKCVENTLSIERILDSNLSK